MPTIIEDHDLLLDTTLERVQSGDEVFEYETFVLDDGTSVIRFESELDGTSFWTHVGGPIVGFAEQILETKYKDSQK